MDPRPPSLVPWYTPPPQPVRLSYRVSELAKLTGLARQTIYERCERGALDCRRDGRAVLVMAESVQRWLGALPGVSG